MTVRRDVIRTDAGSHASPTRPVPSTTPTPPSDAAVPSTTTKDVTRETADWEAEADRIHAFHHHHQAAQYHEREAEWNAGWARWHRAEMARLEGER